MKKLLVCLSILAALSATACAKQEKLYDESKIVKDTGKKAFNGKSAMETVKDMKTGWNLGNTMDAIGGRSVGSETSWGQPKTTKAMIDALSEGGIKTIRIPISWAKHMDPKTYTVDPKWMNRVKEIVDWAIEDDMYVIINSHHDCWERPDEMKTMGGYYPNSKNLEESKRFLYNLWNQIGMAFNNGYDEHLIFETMNEPRLRGTSNEWWNDVNSANYKDAANALNELNQTSLDAIRETGGNNKKRYVMVPGLRAAVDSIMQPEFKLPQDVAKNQLIISVHMYDPYDFAMGTPGAKTFTPSLQNKLGSSFKSLNDKWISAGVPVVIGEYGATNKNNLEERVKWFDFFITHTRQYGMTSCLWDNGQSAGSEKEGERFGYFNRTAGQWFFPEIHDAIIKALDKE